MNCTSPILIRNSRFKSGVMPGETAYMFVPCGKCLACRASKAKEWTYRLHTELSSWNGRASFLTLTYDDEHLPYVHVFNDRFHFGFASPTLRKKDFQDFMKRLRKRLGIKCKVFYCGEYGETTLRPHYHVIFFGASPTELSSELLSEIWGNGFVSVGTLTTESIRYVAGYVQKKLDYEDELAPEQEPPFQGVLKRYQ